MGLFSMNIHALHMKLIIFSVLSIIGKVLNTVNIKIFMIIFAFITCTYAEQSQVAYNGLTTTDILSLDSPSNTMFLSLTTHIECTDMLQSSSTSSVPYTVIYQEYSPSCASHYMHEFYRYDYLFKLQGPFNIQMYANVIEIAMRVLQNTMLKHNFLNCINTILYYRLMPFADILSRQFIFKPLTESISSPPALLHYLSSSSVGGGKIVNPKERTSAYTRGSKFFEGAFLTEFPCFTLTDQQMDPILDIAHIIPLRFELQYIIPKDTVLQYPSPDLVCRVPTARILHKLTKQGLSSLSYNCGEHCG